MLNNSNYHENSDGIHFIVSHENMCVSAKKRHDVYAIKPGAPGLKR